MRTLPHVGRGPRGLVAVAVTSALLSACSGDSWPPGGDASPGGSGTKASESTSVPPGGTGTAEGAGSAAASSGTPSQRSSPATGPSGRASRDRSACSPLSQREAVDQHIGKVAPPPYGTWRVRESVSGFDPCADLSWAVLAATDEDDAPFQIMLFHDGRYLGTTLSAAPRHLPEVVRVDDGALQVNYRFHEEGHEAGEPTGVATATFTWDPETKEVVLAGTLPPVAQDETPRGPSCRELDVHAVVTQNLGTVRPPSPGGEHEWEVVDPTSFDPCQELSWVLLRAAGGGEHSPHQIMLFHRGTYLGTTLRDARSFAPELVRTGPDTLTVTYRYRQAGDAADSPGGRATSTFRWDADRGRVVQSGDLPPED